MIDDPYDFQHEDRAKKAEPFAMVETPITSYQLWSQLTSAFEGGSGYWIQFVEVVDKDKTDGKEGVFAQARKKFNAVYLDTQDGKPARKQTFRIVKITEEAITP